MVTWSTESPRSARSSSTSRYETEKRKYHPTASRMTSGSNCRHLNKPQTDEARRSIRPAYHGLPAKLQHFRKSRQATMLLTKPVHDACLVEIVGGYLKFNEIARGKADEPLPHLSRDVGEYEMFISKRDPKHSSWQHGDTLSFGFNRTLH